MPTPPRILDQIVTELLVADPAAAAVLLLIVHPGTIVEPVYASRKGEGYDSFRNMAEVLRNVADQIEAAHKAAEGKLP